MTVKELKRLRKLSEHAYRQVKIVAHEEACGRWEKQAIEHNDLREISNVLTRAEMYGKLGNEFFVMGLLLS